MDVEKLKHLRAAKGLTQHDLAVRMVSAPDEQPEAREVAAMVRNIQRWEGGHSEPRLAQVHRIAHALDVPVEALLIEAVA